MLAPYFGMGVCFSLIFCLCMLNACASKFELLNEVGTSLRSELSPVVYPSLLVFIRFRMCKYGGSELLRPE